MKTMKRILALLLAVLMVLALAACGQSGDNNNGDDGEESGRRGNRGGKASDTTPKPEYVYAATYEEIKNQPETVRYFYPTLVTPDAFYAFVSEKVGERELNEGEVLEWEGQLDIYENRLYRLGVDGTMTKLEGYKQISAEAEEGHETSSGTYYMVPVNGGGFLTLENVYDSWSTAGDDVELYSDEYWMSWQYEETYYLRELDETGAELSCIRLDTEPLKQEQEYFYFNGMAAAGEHQAILAGESSLYVFDTQSGELLKTISGIDWAQRLMTLSDGRVAVAHYGDNGQQVTILDLESGKLGDSYPVQGDLYNAVIGGGDYDFYCNNGVNFVGCKLETGAVDKLFNWINCDVDNSEINGYTVTEDGRIVGVSMEWDKNYENAKISLVTMNKVPSSTLPEKEVITLATQYLDYYARKEIIKFNRSHDSVRIELLDYSEYNKEDDYDAGLTKLRTEILSGNCPDIIDLNGLPAKQLAAKGVLTDLYALIDADPELSREDFFPAVLKAMENNGRLFSTVSGFEIITAVGASRVVGTEPGWTYAQVMEALREMPEGCTVFSKSETRGDILQMCLMLEMDHFVDWNTGEVRFDSPEFIDLLNFAKTFPADFDWENYEWSEEDSDNYRVREGKQLLIYDGLYDFNSIYNYENIFGGLDAFTYVGFPTSEGVGAMLQTGSGYAISEKCQNKQAAWDFVRVFMTEEYQNENVYNFPSNIHSYETKKNDAMTPVYMKDENGRIMVDPETGEKMMESKGGYWDDLNQEWVDMFFVTEEEVAKIEAVINSTDRVYSMDQAIYDIVNEQVEAFFAGQRSAEDVAKLIQSKARIYVNEQR